MITALQDVTNVSTVNVARVSDRAAVTGDVRPSPATPSAIVVLGAALQPSLVYDASGRLQSQVAQTTTALAAAQMSATFITPGAAQSTLFASAVSFAQVDFAATPSSPNLIAILTSPPTSAAPSDLAVTPLPFTPDAPFTNAAITLEPPVTVNFVAASGSTFNPVTPGTPGTPDITPLVTTERGAPTTPSGVIANTVPILSGAPNTATFALPPSVAAAPAIPAEVEAASPLAASANTFAPSAPTVAAGATTEQAASAALLTPAALADTRIGTPEPAATTVPTTTATAQAEAVLSALNDSSANTVTAAPNVVGTTTTTTTVALPASPIAANAIAVPTATTTNIAPNVAGTLPPEVPAASSRPTQASTTARGSGILTPVDIVTNPFYPAMAASLYLSAMSFRLQQSSAADLNSPADSVQMVGGVRAVSGVESDRQGPADDFRNMTRTFA